LKVLKIALWLVGGLILLALIAVAIFAATFDPNRYRDDVERLVKEQTGRTLQLKGPLEMAYWPSLGARVSGVSLSERAADREFVSLSSAHASVALMPLLRGEVVVDRLRVSGLKAQIVKDEQGRFNFQDLIEAKPGEKPAPKPAEKGDGAPVKFDIASIQIENAAIAYRDLASGQDISLSDLNLQTGRIAENAQGKVDFSTTLKRNEPPLEAKLALDGSYVLKPDAIAVDFNAKLDESSLQGKLDIARAAQIAYGFDLSIDRIDLDRYLASSEKRRPAASEKKGEPKRADDAPVDLSGLKGLNAKGKLQIGALQVQGLKLANLKTEVNAANGKAEIGPHSAALYEGSLAGTLSLDGNANRVALKETLSNIAIGPLLRDFAEQDRVEGRGNVSLDVTAAGKTVNALKSALAGTAKVHLRDGAIKGLDIGGLLRKARTALGSDASQATDSKEKTDFSELSASFVIKNGVARNNDLDLKAPLFRVSGAGEIDIGRQTINYVVKASVVATAQGQGGRELEQLAGVTVPVRLSGPLADVKYQVDYKAAASDLAKSRVKQSIDKRKDRIEEKVRDRLKGLLGR
jgi:AsmA protein